MLSKPFAPDEKIIQLDNNGILFNYDYSVEYAKTNLPKKFFELKDVDIFWRVKQVNYDKINQELILDVVNYDEQDYKSIYLQDYPKHPVERYTFLKLDWEKFEPYISVSKRSELLPILKNASRLQKELSNSFQVDEEGPIQMPEPPKPIVVNATFEVLFEKATFNDGFVTATVINGLLSLNITIANTFIKPQFDYIKLWFKKKFDKPAFKVLVKGSLLNGEFTQEYTYSEEISKINEDFIEQCRIYQVEGFLKKSKEESKKLISISDIFTKPEVAEIFNQETLSELEIINQILAIQKVRNEYQLEFLSGHSKVAAGKIMVSNVPKLGFVFCFQEESKTTFVWELLETNATYLWIFSTANMAFNIIVESVQLEMSKIYEYGRDAYLNRIKENEPFRFHRIFHTKLNETVEGKNQGLELWIARFNKLVF